MGGSQGLGARVFRAHDVFDWNVEVALIVERVHDHGDEHRRDEWSAWFSAAGGCVPSPSQQIMVFDSSVSMLEAAQAEIGIALAPPSMFTHLLLRERIIQPFSMTISLGGYWLTRLQSRTETAAMRDFSLWLLSEMKSECVEY